MDINIFEWEREVPSNFSNEEIDSALEIMSLVEIFRWVKNSKEKSSREDAPKLVEIDEQDPTKILIELLNKNESGKAMALVCEMSYSNSRIGSFLQKLAETKERNDPELALKLFFYAIFMEPESPVNYLHAANCQIALGKGEKALESLDMALKIVQEKEEGKNLKGQIELMKKKVMEKFNISTSPSGVT